MTLKSILIVSLLGLLGSTSSFADRSMKEFSETVYQQLKLTDEKLACQDWKATQLYFTLAPSVAFEIPEIFEVKFVPEVTLVWARDDL